MLRIYRYSLTGLAEKLIKKGFDYEAAKCLRCIFDAINHGDIAAYFEPPRNLVFSKDNLFCGSLLVLDHSSKDYIEQNILPIGEIYLVACDYSISWTDPRYPNIEIDVITNGGNSVYIYQVDGSLLRRADRVKVNASDIFISAEDAEKLMPLVDPENEIIEKFKQSEIFKKHGSKTQQGQIENWLAKTAMPNNTREEQRGVKAKINKACGITTARAKSKKAIT